MLAFLVPAISLVGFAAAQQISFAPGTGVRSLWVSVTGMCRLLQYLPQTSDRVLKYESLDSLQNRFWHPAGFHSLPSKTPII